MANTIFKLKKSSVAGRVPDSSDLAYGELAINYHDGKLYYKSDSNFIASFTNDIGQDHYTTVDFESDFGTKTADDVPNGTTNMYYSTTLFDSDFALKTTDDLTEGSNLYYTIDRVILDARQAIGATDAGGDGSLSYNDSTGIITYTGPSATEVRSHFAAAGDLNYDSATGVFSFASGSTYDTAAFDSDFGTKTTDNLTEGSTNLYYTTARADSDIAVKVDATFINALTIDADTLGGQAGSYYHDYTNLTNTPNVLDSSDVLTTVATFGYATQTYVTNSLAVLPDSAQVSAIITADVDAAFINALTIDADTLGGQAGSYYLNYTNFTNTPNVLDSADVRNIFSVSGDLAYNSGTGQFSVTTYKTANFNSDLATKSTADVAEGSNLYYTTVRADSDFDTRLATKSTADVAEGSNLYYTTARADSDFDTRLATKSTTNVTEGSNLYYTTARADSDFDVRLATKSTTDVAEGSNLYYTTARADSDAKNAISVTDAGGDGSLTYNSGTGIITYTGPSAAEVRAHLTGGSNITITDGVISLDSALDVSSTYMDFTPQNPGPAYSEGRVFYHDEYKALTVYNDEADIALQVGQEEWVRVYNNTGSTITNGTPVYITGATGETPTVAPADATTSATARCIGLATHDIEDATNGYVTVRGLVADLNTSGITAGMSVHLAPDGTLQNAAPTYPYYPTEVGVCVVSDSALGYMYVDTVQHYFEQLRITGNTHFDGNLTIDGDLTVNGTQSIVSQANLAIDNSFVYLNSGDTIGDANTTFTGSGLDDGTFTGHYNGTTTKTFYTRIDATGTPDTFEWSYDSDFAATEATGVAITGSNQALANNVSMFFNATTGHTLNDVWSGTAAPTNVDTGWFTNRNTGATGVGYTHMGVYYDVSDNKYKFVDVYDPEPEGTINTGDSSFALGTVVANTFEGGFTGNLTGNVTGNAASATALATSRTIAITGDITGTATAFNGTANIAISSAITAGSIVNADINAAAAIVDTKLNTISTAGKVLNSATTATSANTASAIVARDGSGNFTAGVITATTFSGSGASLTSIPNSATTATSANTLSAIVARDASGNFTAGTITATAFVGDGSSLTGLPAGYTITNFDSDFGTKTTDNLTEGTNKYFATSLVDAHLSGSTGITYSAGAISITNTGVSANTYGDAANIPQFAVNAQGQITSVSNIAVNIPAGYTQTNFDSDVAAQSAELLTSIKTVDGAGSGLDADLLDGQQGAYYRINIYDNTGALLN